MGVFVGDRQSANATRCGREIFWTTENVIASKATERFTSIKKNNIEIHQCVGIDAGECHAVRAGIRDNDDLIWVGKPPSLAAKLSDLREFPYCVFISEAVHGRLADKNEIFNGKPVWENRSMNFAGATESVYRTSIMIAP